MDQSAAAHGGAPRVAGTGFGPAQIDEAVAGEARVEDHVAKAALAAIIDCRHAFDDDGVAVRLPTERAFQPQPSALFRHEEVAVGQKGHRPGFRILGDGSDGEALAGGRSRGRGRGCRSGAISAGDSPPKPLQPASSRAGSASKQGRIITSFLVFIRNQHLDECGVQSTDSRVSTSPPDPFFPLARNRDPDPGRAKGTRAPSPFVLALQS